MKGGRFVAGGSCRKSSKSMMWICPRSSGAACCLVILILDVVLKIDAMPCQNSSSTMETSSSNKIPSCSSACTSSSSK
eukprot:8854528-Karenia_brevis.AAC.1